AWSRPEGWGLNAPALRLAPGPAAQVGARCRSKATPIWLTPPRLRASVARQPATEETMRAIIAYLTAKPGKEAEFQEKMTAQAKRCLANEPGCLQFDVAQDPKDKRRFVMLEVYQDDGAIKAHQESQHY